MSDSNEIIFDRIINSGYWRDHPCGTGSLLENTENLRSQLPDVMRELGCVSLLDAPCGDYSWMSTVIWPQGFTYIGADVVSGMVQRLRQQWPAVDFRHLDITVDTLPQVDIMLCRDCLIHFPWQAIRQTVANVVRSGIGFLATTSYTPGEQNDIDMGGCHHISLRQSPACFPEPLYAILDQGHQTRQHHIMVWSREQLQQALDTWK